jgi:FkbM family methyltransferase
MAFVSYAHNGEDVILHRVFGGQESGFYVDVGAHDPVVGSVTKALHDRGWSGINIEPGSKFPALVAARPRDVNLQMAVMDRSGEVAFVEHASDGGISGSAPGVEAIDAGRMVPCDTLETVIRAHSGEQIIDFVRLGTGGSELPIVRSTDWRWLRPPVLLIKATRPGSSALMNQEWEPDLLRQGFVRVYFDGINCFYVPEEQLPALKSHFQTPVNALDRFERYETIVLRTALDAQKQTTVRLAAERDLLQAALDGQQHETARLITEGDELNAAANLQTGEMAATSAAPDAQQQPRAKLAAGRDERGGEDNQLTEVLGEPATGPMLSAPSAYTPAPQPLTARKAARRMALVAYRLVRPIARPIAWRLRGFMVAGLSEQLRQLSDKIGIQSVPSRIGHDGTAATEMLRLAAEMERTLLTLALERASEPWPSAVPVPTEPAPTTRRQSLLLPHGRVIEVECAPDNLSASAPASRMAPEGDWEPHVRRYLEAVVQPDWVCLDIGAKIGAHTLSLAVLANEGRVVGFEADAANFKLLCRNALGLEGKRAAIEPVHVALWDSPGTLVCGSVDEEAECSLLAEDELNPAFVERLLRRAVNTNVMNDGELHIRLKKVPAVSLDAWVAESQLPRLDLIRLNAEGSQVRVICGADATFRLHRPILIAEIKQARAGECSNPSPDALFRELETRFGTICALEPHGALSPIRDWAAMQERLVAGRGREHLVCLSPRSP